MDFNVSVAFTFLFFSVELCVSSLEVCRLHGKTVATQCFLKKKLFFCWRHHMMWCNFLLNVLAIFMVEEFYIYAVVQFFSQEKV